MKWLGAACWLLEWQQTKILLDPFFHRPRDAKPVLPIGPADLPPLDYLLVTHAHWDHFADAPALAVENARQSYLPKAALGDLERRHRRTRTADRKRGPNDWHGVVGGERIVLDGLTIAFHHIGTERFDLATIWDATKKLRKGGNLESFQGAYRFLSGHLYGACFAISFELHEPALTVVFFGNLAIDVSAVQLACPQIDLCVLPYCPANTDWLHESVCVASRLDPKLVLVHHFDQFFPPVTVGLDVPAYLDAIKQLTAVPATRLAKFCTETTLSQLLDAAARPAVAQPAAKGGN